MIFSLNWLKEYLKGNLLPVNDLIDLITLKSFEVEGFKKNGNDYLIDVDILSNRSPDCYCYTGLAQEISAIYPKVNFNLPKVREIKSQFKSRDYFKLQIESDKVIRASKRIVRNVKITKSPKWLQDKLIALGLNPVNNIVDLTNFVMWETGQPVHAFDLDKIESKEIFIRAAKNKEIVVSLDNKRYELNKDDLVISDSKKALDIAGIKGGINSGIDNSTSNILISACNFCPITIRKTSHRLNLLTDASKRFENNISPNKVEVAMGRISDLISQEVGGQFSEIIDINKNKKKIKSFIFNEEEILKIIGLEISTNDVKKIFKKLGIECYYQNKKYKVFPNPFRNDLNFKEDFIEELIRIYGYEFIKDQENKSDFPLAIDNLEFTLKNLITNYLINSGFTEVYLHSLIPQGKIKILKPVSQDKNYLRENLLFSLNQSALDNLKNYSEIKIFEFGKIFYHQNQEIFENLHLAVSQVRKNLKENEKAASYYNLKKVLLNILSILKIENYSFTSSKDKNYIAEIKIDNKFLGLINYDGFEINFNLLIEKYKFISKFKNFSIYPYSEKDIAVFVPLDTKSSEVSEIITSVLNPENFNSIEIFDVFEKKDKDKKSLAFRIRFQSINQTLSNDFLTNQLNKVYSILKKQKNFEIR